MSPTSSSMAGYHYGSTAGGYAGAAMYAAAATASTTKESPTSFSSSLMAAGDSINSLRLKAKQHSTSSSPTAVGGSSNTISTSYYPASVSPGKSNSSESPNLTLNPGGELYNNGVATSSV